MSYLAIDPGETNGAAVYNSKGGLQALLTIKIDELTEMLQKIRRSCKDDPLERIIVEEYRVYPHKAKDHVYSKLNTTRAIGRIESFAEICSIPVSFQGASLKTTGYRYLGKKPKPKSDPGNHAMDAHAHGTYWLVNNGIIDPARLLED